MYDESLDVEHFWMFLDVESLDVECRTFPGIYEHIPNEVVSQAQWRAPVIRLLRGLGWRIA